MIYLFGKAPNQDSKKALSAFSALLKMHPEDKWYLYDYGLAGIFAEDEAFEKKWPDLKKQIERLHNRYGTDRYKDSKEYRKLQADFDAKESRKQKFVDCIRRAAAKGCDPAKKFLDKYQ